MLDLTSMLILGVTLLGLCPLFTHQVRLYSPNQAGQGIELTGQSDSIIRPSWKDQLIFVILTTWTGSLAARHSDPTLPAALQPVFLLLLSTLCGINIKTGCTSTFLSWSLLVIGSAHGVWASGLTQSCWGALAVGGLPWAGLGLFNFYRYRVFPELHNDLIVLGACGACFGIDNAGAMLLSIGSGFIVSAFVTAMTMGPARSKMMLTGPLLWTVGAGQVFHLFS